MAFARRWVLAGLAAAAAGPALAKPRFSNSLGQPDFEGVWSSLTGTRLERPKAFTTQWATIAEAEAHLAKVYAPPPDDADKVGQFHSEWWDFSPMTEINGRALTSFIVDPPDGKLPYSEQGRALNDAVVKKMEEDTSSYEMRDTYERCLYGIAGPPLGSISFGSLFKIVQTRDQVAIFSEVMHDLRLISLTGKPAATTLPTWTGTSTGRFEGDTLVVETADFHPTLTVRAGDFFLSPKAKVRERFRRLSAAELLYEFEVDDPAIYTQVWRAMMLLKRSDAAMFEYACHEGNYGLANILAGAREEEKKAPSPNKPSVAGGK